MTLLTNITTTGLTKHTVAVVGNMAKGTININHKTIIEVFMEVYLKVIARRNTIFIKS
jgi:ribosomal protein S9